VAFSVNARGPSVASAHLGEARCATGDFLEIGTCAERPAGNSFSIANS